MTQCALGNHFEMHGSTVVNKVVIGPDNYPGPVLVVLERLNTGKGGDFTILAGTKLKFRFKHGLTIGNGRVNLLGTGDNPIVLTCWNDDSIGGDTNLSKQAPKPGAASQAEGIDPRKTSFATYWYRIRDGAGKVVERGNVSASRDEDGGFAKLRWNIHKGGPSEVTVDLPFHQVGWMQRLAEGTYLISGQILVGEKLFGVLTLARCSRKPTQSLQLSNTGIYRKGLDHYRVVRDVLDKKLYSLDWESQSCLTPSLRSPLPC